jgi:hypothetical protein
MKIDSNGTNPISNGTTNSATDNDSTLAASLMPEANQMLSTGDPGAILAALAMKTGDAQKQTARRERDNAAKAENNEEQAEIQDMHDKADLQRIQGIVDGGCQIAAGATQMGAGFEQLNASAEQSEAASEKQNLQTNGPSYSPDHQQADEASITALGAGAASDQRTATYLTGTSAAFNAGKSVADGLFGGATTDKDADAKAHDVAANTFKQMGDDAHDAENDAKDLMNKAMDFYKEYLDTKAQTAMAAIHRA